MCSCPSRTDEPLEGDGYNQSPPQLSGDLTTNQDLNGIANSRELRDHGPHSVGSSSNARGDDIAINLEPPNGTDSDAAIKLANGSNVIGQLPGEGFGPVLTAAVVRNRPGSASPPDGGSIPVPLPTRVKRIAHSLVTYTKFVGPGFMIAVAYSP